MAEWCKGAAGPHDRSLVGTTPDGRCLSCRRAGNAARSARYRQSHPDRRLASLRQYNRSEKGRARDTRRYVRVGITRLRARMARTEEQIRRLEVQLGLPRSEVSVHG